MKRKTKYIDQDWHMLISITEMMVRFIQNGSQCHQLNLPTNLYSHPKN